MRQGNIKRRKLYVHELGAKKYLVINLSRISSDFFNCANEVFIRYFINLLTTFEVLMRQEVNNSEGQWWCMDCNSKWFIWAATWENVPHYENTPIQIYKKFHLQKLKIFRWKTLIFFHISAQNMDCGYSLEPPRWGGSNEYPQSMSLSRNKKNNAYPCKSQFYYIKVGFKGVKIK